MNKNITNIVVDLGKKTRVTIRIDDDVLDLVDGCCSMDFICQSIGNKSRDKAAALSIAHAAALFKSDKEVPLITSPILATCIKQITKLLWEKHKEDYSGVIYIKHEPTLNKVAIGDFLRLAISGKIKKRKNETMYIKLKK